MDIPTNDACFGIKDCRSCIKKACYFLQFDTGTWACVERLMEWKNVQRVIGRHFEELCDRISTTEIPKLPSVDNLVVDSHHETGSHAALAWSFSVADIVLLLMIIVGFLVLFKRDRRLLLAIGEIPDQVRLLHARHNNYYLQLEQQARDEQDLPPHHPPIPLPPPNHSQSRQNLQLVPLQPSRSPNHSFVDKGDVDEDETSFSTPESSPKAPPRENFITRFGRLVRIPRRF